MATPDIDERITRGIELLTAYLERPDGGDLSETLLRAVLGNHVTDDDVIAAQKDMLLAAEMVMMTYEKATGMPRLEVLRKVAAFQQTRDE